MTQVFIDGSAGTTGLRIRERLAGRKDLEMIVLPEEKRKDPAARKEALNAANVVFLCLPDDAAREAASWVLNPKTVVIDTSTAHRTQEGWVYGFPELGDQRRKIRESRRIANPGCHATGFISLVAPLVKEGGVRPDAILSCFSLTGYSGGGKKMIAEYEAPDRSPLLAAPRAYGLYQTHKHLKEMTAVCGLENPPVFCPVVAPFYAGMEVVVSLSWADTYLTPDAALAIYDTAYFGEKLISLPEHADEEGFLSACAMAGRDDLEISVWGNEDRMLLVSRFDNLGKGASGAAIQNMNLALGLDETEGLVFGN